MRELKQYIRRLWPYAIVLIVMSVFAYLIILWDKNSVEMNASISAIAFFSVAALTFVARGFIQAYISFYNSLRQIKIEQSNYKKFVAGHILAFIIFVIFTALFILACILVIAWKQVGKMFLALNSDWIYCVEFCIWLIIVMVTIYFILISWIVSFRYCKYKKLMLSVGIVILLTIELPIVLEILLLIHSSSTDMPSVWVTLITLLAMYVLVDITMYFLMCHTLKTAISNKQTENE